MFVFWLCEDHDAPGRCLKVDLCDISWAKSGLMHAIGVPHTVLIPHIIHYASISTLS
jgi:hypothetical protein